MEISEKKRIAAIENLKKATAVNIKNGRVLKLCGYCKKECLVTNKQVKYGWGFCSKRCVGKSLTGKRNPNFKDLGNKVCVNCGKEYKSYIKARKYCCFSCYSGSDAAKKHRIKNSKKGLVAAKKSNRYVGAIDHNQSEIVDALRRAGASVLITSNIGGGFPDLIVGRAGKNYLIEIKNPKTSYGKAGLNPRQKEFSESWPGCFNVAYCVDDALKIIGLL